MPTARFTELPASLETRVGNGLAARLSELVGLGVAVHERYNQTVHDEALVNRTSDAVLQALKPGSLPFLLLVVVSGALVVHAVLVRRHTHLILNAHGDFLLDNGLAAKAHAE